MRYIGGMRFKAVYFGGGSPSLLHVDHVARLYSALKNSFDIEDDAEWTFEGEPHGLSNRTLLSFLLEHGIRRISYGVQTFDRNLRQALTIAATVEDVLAALSLAREVGFREINIDMMFHLPGQTLDALELDVCEIARYGFDSVDYYYMSYYALPPSVFVQMDSGGFPRQPPLGLRIDMNYHIRHRMNELGYTHVTDHVFSKSGFGSVYYRLLWGGGSGEFSAETLALGASARGYLNGISYANTLAHDSYIQQVQRDELPVFKVSDRVADPRSRAAVFFPKFFEIREDRLPSDDTTRRTIRSLVANGLARRCDGKVILTDTGKDWIPNITADLLDENQRRIGDGWVERLNSQHANRVTL